VFEQPAAAEAGSVRRAVRPVFILTLVGTASWVAAIFLAPYLKSRASDAAASFFYALFAPVCHQIPERSFSYRGFPLGVCARCLGIYTGCLGGLILYPFLRGLSRIAPPTGRLFLLVTLPVGLDFAGGLFGLWSSPKGLRFATGSLWGLLLPFYFISGVAELLLWRAARRAATNGAPGPRAAGHANPSLTVGQGLDNRGEKKVK